MNQISIKNYQINTRGSDTKTYQLVAAPIGNTKTTEEIQFHPEAPVLKYHQKSYNSCFLSSLASAFHSIGGNRDVTSLVNCIGESFTLQTYKFRNIINFSNAIMTNSMHIKDEQHLRYNMKVWYKRYDFDILKNISEYVTLVQLIDSLGNVNNSISTVGYWIFYSNYDKALCLTKIFIGCNMFSFHW